MTESVNAVMPVAPTYGGFGMNGGFGGWGSDIWLILIVLFAMGGFGGMGWGGFGGFGGGFGNMFEFPWLLNGQQNILSGVNANTNAGFNQAATQSALGDISTALTSGFGNVQTSLCSGFAGVNATVNNAQNALAQQLYSNQIADLERSFASQTATTNGMNSIGMSLQNCCCENRANIADLKYTVATENCADRAAISDGIRDILAATQNQTQTILNQLCADKIEQKNDTIAQLRSELLYARGQASQDVQTALIQAGQRSLANEVEQYVAPRAIPAYAVQNPNCCYNNGCGCGCGSF